MQVKVARYSFSGLISPKMERKLSVAINKDFGKIVTTVVLDKGENLL